ncbi:MAG: MOSC domain-containing protein [Deltaproteobacteria bacterium]|nr:MOSC domain-containing protein [Deltaproteobacteria bacterium]
MIVGRIGELWRYPVKSMKGERIDAAKLGTNGIPGDRGWAGRDEVRGGIRGAKKLAELMRCGARYLEEPEPGRVPAPEITLPDGARLRASDAEASKRLSQALRNEVTLWPLLPAEKLDHYRRGAPTHADFDQEMRAVFGRAPDEPLPDFSVFPPVLFEFESPPGTYFDAFPLLLLTSATLGRLQKLAPASRVDVRRFRPNLLITTPDGVEDFAELGWIGKRLRIGDVEISVPAACPRCVMISHGFDDLPKDPGLIRTVVREANQNVGVYGSIERAGRIAVGDAVELL